MSEETPKTDSEHQADAATERMLAAFSDLISPWRVREELERTESEQ